MPCKYYLHFNGEVKEFTEQQLDRFIWDNRNSFEEHVDNLIAIRDTTTPQQNIVDTIKKFHEDSKARASRSTGIVSSMHVTDIWSSVSPLYNFKAKKTSKEYWKAQYKADNEHKGNPVTDDDAEAAYATYEATESAAKIAGGTNYHEFLGSYVPSHGEEGTLSYDSGKNPANKFIDYLDGKFGKGKYIALAEQSMAISGDKIEPHIKQALIAAISLNTGKSLDEVAALFDCVVGTADLIVITDSGEVHIFDYKTSRKRFPNNWYLDDGTAEVLGRGTRQKYEAQTWSYSAMLEAVKGIKNIYCHIAGFHTNDANQVDEFMGVIDLKPAGEIKQNVYRMFSIFPQYNSSTIDKTHAVTKAMFGDQAYVTKVAEAYQASVEDFMKRTTFFREEKEGSELHKKGFNYSFYNFLTKKRVGVKDTYTDGRQKVEEYVKELNEANATKLCDLGKSLVSCTSKQDFYTIVRSAFSRTNESFCHELSKYISSGWSLLDNDILFANGIFIFNNGLRYEIVMVDTSANSLFYEPKLRRGTSILGNFLSDDAVGADDRFHMKGNIGDMLIMKAAAFIATNPEIFKGAKISRIIALNPGREEAITTCPNGWILQNFRSLTRYAGLAKNSNRIIDIGDILMEDAEAALAVAEDYLQELNYNDNQYNNLLSIVKTPKTVYTIEVLRDVLGKLKKTETQQADANVQRAFAEIYKAILWLDGNYALVTEKDIKKFGSILTFSGGFVAPAALSPSANLRILNDINVSFSNAIARDVQKRAIKWQNMYSDLGIADWTGGEWKFFTNWFEQDSSGKVTTEFKIKNASDSYWRTRPKEWEMAKYMLDQFWKFKTYQEPTELDRENDLYYQVPLCESTNLEIIETTGGIKGIKNALIREWTQLINVGEETINGQRTNIRLKDINIDVPVIKNGYFDIDAATRKENLEDPKKGPGYYEKNLDLVFLYVLTASVKEEQSRHFMPFFTGLRALLSIENELGGAAMTDIAKTVDAYIKTVVFHGSLVPEEMRLLSRVIGKLKGLVSKGLLSLSSVAVVRELLSNHIKLAATKIAEMKKDKTLSKEEITLFDNFTLKNFEKAYADMIYGAAQGFRSNSFDYQFNTRFRVANMSFREIPHRLKMNKYGLRNLDSNVLYLNVMAPDYIIRNALIKAVLMTMGAYDAYSLNENNELTYDMSKDKRFSLLFKYKQGEKFAQSDWDHVPISERNEYKNQEALYLKSLENWRIQGERLEIGDLLPEALDPEEQITIGTQSVKLFGNFDDEQKSLIQKTLLGGLFLQFKTYGICNWYNYVMPMTHTNILRFVDATDAEGTKYWLVYATEEERANGYPSVYQVSDDEITEDQKRRGSLIKETTGVPAEGKFKTMLDLLAAAATGDKATLQKLWDDRKKRANLFLILHDTLFFVLIAGLMRLIFGEEKIDSLSEQDYWTRWTYTVAMGVAQDGPFWEIANSLWSDGKIPAYRTLQRWATTALSVINGNTSFTYGILNSIGATREFTSLLDEI